MLNSTRHGGRWAQLPSHRRCRRCTGERLTIWKHWQESSVLSAWSLLSRCHVWRNIGRGGRRCGSHRERKLQCRTPVKVSNNTVVCSSIPCRHPKQPMSLRRPAGINSSAEVHPSVSVGKQAEVASYCYTGWTGNSILGGACEVFWKRQGCMHVPRMWHRARNNGSRAPTCPNVAALCRNRSDVGARAGEGCRCNGRRWPKWRVDRGVSKAWSAHGLPKRR